MLMSTRHCIIRKFKGNYGAAIQCIDSFILEYTFLTVITFFLLNSSEYEVRFMDFVIGTVAGALMCIARIFISVAVAKGIASCA